MNPLVLAFIDTHPRQPELDDLPTLEHTLLNVPVAQMLAKRASEQQFARPAPDGLQLRNWLQKPATP